MLLFNEAALPGPVATAVAGISPGPIPSPPAGLGTIAYNWATGQRSPINWRAFDACGATGLLYSRLPDGSAWRFSTAETSRRDSAPVLPA